MHGDETFHELVSLPPPEVRLFFPKSYDERAPTPLDHHGFVDIHKTIDLVKSFVKPDYIYPKETSVHHFQHAEARYSHIPFVFDGRLYKPSTFRNLPWQKGLVPREFENLLHETTQEPPVPAEDEMAHRIDASKVLRSLFATARKTIVWQKRQRRRRENIQQNPNILKNEFNGEDVIGEEVMYEVLENHFRAYEEILEQQEKIPDAHRIIDISGPPEIVAKNLGKFVAKRNIDYRWKVAS